MELYEILENILEHHKDNDYYEKLEIYKNRKFDKEVDFKDVKEVIVEMEKVKKDYYSYLDKDNTLLNKFLELLDQALKEYPTLDNVRDYEIDKKRALKLFELMEYEKHFRLYTNRFISEYMTAYLLDHHIYSNGEPSFEDEKKNDKERVVNEFFRIFCFISFVTEEKKSILEIIQKKNIIVMYEDLRDYKRIMNDETIIYKIYTGLVEEINLKVNEIEKNNQEEEVKKIIDHIVDIPTHKKFVSSQALRKEVNELTKDRKVGEETTFTANAQFTGEQKKRRKKANISKIPFNEKPQLLYEIATKKEKEGVLKAEDKWFFIAVHSACCGIWKSLEKEKEKVFTLSKIYRVLVGIDEEKHKKTHAPKIEEKIKEMLFVGKSEFVLEKCEHEEIIETDEIKGKTEIVGDNILNWRIRYIRENNGSLTEGYELLVEPMFLKNAELIGNIRDEKAELTRTEYIELNKDGSISFRNKRIDITDIKISQYLYYRVGSMKSNTNLVKKIPYSVICEEILGTTEYSKVQKVRVRDKAELILKNYKAKKFIKYFKETRDSFVIEI